MRHSVRVDLHVRAKGAGDPSPVRVRVSWNGRRCNLFPGLTVEPAKWDPVARRVLENESNARGQSAGYINGKIQDALNAVEKAFNKYEFLEGRYPSEDELKAEFAALLGLAGSAKAQERALGPLDLPFFKVWDLFVRTVSVSNEWTEDTHKKFRSLRNHLKAYNSRMPRLEKLKESDLAGFLEYLRNNNIRNSTAAKYTAFLREFLRWAAKEGYNPTSFHELWRPKFKGGDGSLREIIYLEWEELMRLYSFEFPEKVAPYLGPVRDAFCFCCFTSLRYSDLAKLRRADIVGDHLYVVTQKTADPLRIELNKYSRAILERYAGIEFPEGRALPVLSNQKMNDHLKEIGRLCGFDAPHHIVYFVGSKRYEENVPKWSVLSTHAARRTFVVNALRLGIPSDVVMSWTGHSNHKAMRPYTKIVDTLKAQEMEKFNSYEGGPEK